MKDMDMTLKPKSKAKSKAHRSDYRMARLIAHLENQLASAETAPAAAELLTKILLAQAAYKNDAAERQLKRELATPKPPVTVESAHALIESLKKQAAQ
jgi:hypothetical protein